MGDKPQIKGGTFKSVGHLKGMFNKTSSLIINVPADSTKVIRFLTEPDQWFAYQEYWDNEKRRYIPVADGVEPPVRPSQRFLAQVVDRETDQVIALKMPKDLTNRLVLRFDRYNTIMDRDYEIMRTGKGLDTSYDVTPEAPTSFEAGKYTNIDLLDILETAFNSAIGDDNALFSKTPKAEVTDDSVDFVEDDDSIEETTEESEELFEDIVEEDTEEVEENVSSDYIVFDTAEEIKEFFDEEGTVYESVEEFNTTCWGDELYKVEELKDLTTGELKEMCTDFDIAVTGASKEKLAEKIIKFQTDYIADMTKYAKATGFYPAS
jgi:hypothetical protein